MIANQILFYVTDPINLLINMLKSFFLDGLKWVGSKTAKNEKGKKSLFWHFRSRKPYFFKNYLIHVHVAQSR